MAPSPLQQLHEQAEATFLPYGPALQVVESYGEPEAEYAALRKSAALLDAPHRSVVILTGKDRLAFLQNKLTNDTQSLTPGRGCYAYLLNLKGRIVMDMAILQTEEATLVDLDSRLAPQFLSTMEKYIFTEDVRLLDGAQQLARLTLLGPKAAELLKKILDRSPDVGAALPDNFRNGKFALGSSNLTIFRNDLAGEPQFELIVPRDQAVALWQIFHEAAADHDDPAPNSLALRAIGWSAFNTARIEAGSPLFGIDFTDQSLPMETGPWYPRAVNVAKGCYLGQEIVARMHAHKTVAKLLTGLRIEGERLPLAGTQIFESTDSPATAPQVGIITSSCFSPMLGNAPIALATVKKPFAAAGKKFQVLAEGARSAASAQDLPLWKKISAPQ